MDPYIVIFHLELGIGVIIPAFLPENYLGSFTLDQSPLCLLTILRDVLSLKVVHPTVYRFK
jgi:hypothetical protein